PQRLAFRHLVAFVDHQLLDDAALEMLDDLVLAGGDERALRDHGGGERRGRRPDAEAAEAEAQERQAKDGMSADRARHLAVPLQVLDLRNVGRHRQVSYCSWWPNEPLSMLMPREASALSTSCLRPN